ncbi:DUF2786 domain-containing protein [Ornithinimicrobium cerasi]|uniref:Uncharacterized protein n=1 Tax=Ornithinimicrobium cerasi TaxID=2248773 RepID=A0A285VP96_9MICO|nr:DUF2786 domain-containing protein [Ornithinimicrobium cerasi]SOC55727.1 Protein of unknown function [Ornithinimicrobium cerasi]
MGHREQGSGPRSGAVAEQARTTVEALLRRARRVPAPLPVRALLVREEDPALRAAVAGLLDATLTAAVGQAWVRGWQPADLERATRREHGDEVVLAVADAVRTQLRTYARSTVDPRWWQQVEELPAGGRGRPGRRSRPAADPAAAWISSCAVTLEAAVLVERLPVIPVIGPLPGQHRHADSEAAPVDDKLLTRVRRLLAQAEGTPYEAEAETFTAAAQSLMARYRIDRAMLESTDPERAGHHPDAVRLSVDRPYEAPKMQLLHQICLANRCRTVWSQTAGFATVIGFEGDRRAVELLYTSLLVQATTAMRREGESTGQAARSRGFRSSFLLGFATCVGQRLQDASREEETRASVRLEEGSTNGAGIPAAHLARTDALAVVLGRRDEEVTARTRELFPRVQTGRARQVSDYAGFMQGRAAADRADLGAGGRLTGRAS